MKTYNPYINNGFREKGLLDLAKAQMLWLRENTELSYAKIGDIVGYAKGTVSSYLYQFADNVRYLLDVFKEAVQKVKEKVIPTTTTTTKVIYNCEEVADGVPTAYVTEIFNNNKFSFIKIGFSAHMPTRMKAHSKNKKYGENNTVVVHKCFCFKDKEQALTMENVLRKFFKEKNNCKDYIKQDRFTAQRVSNEILLKLQEKAEFVLNNF